MRVLNYKKLNMQALLHEDNAVYPVKSMIFDNGQISKITIKRNNECQEFDASKVAVFTDFFDANNSYTEDMEYE